jgi:putative DNA primase/helicase
MDTIKFLKTIYENAETGYTEIFTLPFAIGTACAVEDLDKVAGILPNIPPGQNTYFTPGMTTGPINSKPSNDDIIGIPALWVDIDIFDPNNPDTHAKKNLPRSVDEARTLLPLAPSLIVHSGFGIHCYWQFRECWYFDTPEEKQEAERLSTRLQACIRQRAAQSGWHLDATFDLSRIMRLPGTVNYKNPQQPIMAGVIEQSDIRYNPSDFDSVLPAMEQTAATTERRTEAFERRETDGPAEYMLTNCMFMQHCQLNAKTLSYGEWLAMITNLVRAIDGIEAVHAMSALDPNRYNQSDCDKKIDEALGAMNPQNCEYIRSLGFLGCPQGGCGMAAPCGWSLGRVPQAKAIVRAITVPTPEAVYNAKTLGALALLQKQSPADYDIFYQRCGGQLNKNTLRHEISEFRKANSGFTVLEGGQADSDQNEPEGDGRTLASMVPDIPLDLKLPTASSNYFMWQFNKSGVSMIKETDRGKQVTKVSYVPILITDRIYNIDSGQEKAVVAFKTHRNQWRSVTLPKSTVFDAKKIMCLADNGLIINSEMARGLTKWLSSLEAANASTIPDKKGVGKLGWRDHETKFIFPGLETGYTLDLGDTGADGAIDGYGVAGDLGVWIEAMRKLRTRPKARFILAASFAAPLLKIVGQRIFCIHNWGTTADGKSATLFAALSAWGDPDNLKQTFNQTNTFVERTAELFTDLPLGVNEYEVLTDRKKGDQDQLTYMICEGKGRGRAKREGLQKTSQWRTIAISNGETPLTRNNSRGGVITRVLEFNGGPLADDKIFASDLYHVTATNHGHAGRLFIEMLLKANHDEIRDLYNKTRYVLRNKYTDNLESHLDAVACVSVADYLISQWIFAEGKDAAVVGAATMSDHIISELVLKSESDESERVWEWLQDWLAANEGRLSRNFNANKNQIVALGYHEDGCINIIKSELTAAMRAEGYSPEKIFRSWADKGRIACSSLGGKKTFGIRGKLINGIRPYVIRIREEEKDFSLL